MILKCLRRWFISLDRNDSKYQLPGMGIRGTKEMILNGMRRWRISLDRNDSEYELPDMERDTADVILAGLKR